MAITPSKPNTQSKPTDTVIVLKADKTYSEIAFGDLRKQVRPGTISGVTSNNSVITQSAQPYTVDTDIFTFTPSKVGTLIINAVLYCKMGNIGGVVWLKVQVGGSDYVIPDTTKSSGIIMPNGTAVDDVRATTFTTMVNITDITKNVTLRLTGVASVTNIHILSSATDGESTVSTIML